MSNRWTYPLIILLGGVLSAPLVAETPEFRDPFRNPDTPAEPTVLAPPLIQAEQLHVQAVFGQNVAPERRRALVNGQVMVVGDLIGVFTLIEIDHRGIVHFRHQDTGEVQRVHVHDGPA